MINTIDFKAKNLISNAGLLLLFTPAKSGGVFDLLENEIVFADKGIDKINMVINVEWHREGAAKCYNPE